MKIILEHWPCRDLPQFEMQMRVPPFQREKRLSSASSLDCASFEPLSRMRPKCKAMNVFPVPAALSMLTRVRLCCDMALATFFLFTI